MGRLKPGRRERKFTLSDDKAEAIRQFVRAYLPRDPHMNGADQLGYRVRTLYLDTPQLELYRRTVDGKKNRFKLRMRFYDETEDGIVFLEVKNRVSKTIVKRRAAIRKPAAERLLAGEYLTAEDLLVPDDQSALAIAEFCENRDLLRARGILFSAYQREAFGSYLGERARVTFDRNVAAQPYSPDRGLRPADSQTFLSPADVVLELKHTGDPPDWMQDLTKCFQLQRTSYPKYVYCADALHLASSARDDQPLHAATWGGYARGLA
jgi:hypothetical protein